MKIHESAEDYLETILILKERIINVRSIDIVEELNYSKPSISIAMKKFRNEGYITVDASGFIELTPVGLEIAQNVYNRHKTLTSFLTSIGIDETIAAEDACRIEHIIHAETFQKIQEFLDK